MMSMSKQDPKQEFRKLRAQKCVKLQNNVNVWEQIKTCVNC